MIVWAFDLDGTIADYGQPVSAKVASHLNHLSHVHIITGSDQETAEKATRLLSCKTIHAIRSHTGNKSIDCAAIMGTDKKHFVRTAGCQVMRRNLCLALRSILHEHVYIGGRSTIDIMPVKNKGQVIRKLQENGDRVVYFYDCRWSMNEDVNNDVPAIREAWKSVRTDYKHIIRDLKECQKSLS